MKKIIVSWVLFLNPIMALAALQGIYNGETLQSLSLSDALAQVQPGSIIVVGENHGYFEHQKQHIEILRTLRSMGHSVSVGMEFFSYPNQVSVDAYLNRQISEAEMLKRVGWTSPSFNYYRDQVLFPRPEFGERVVALNMPRSVTSKISQKGWDALTDQDKALLPPQFTLGRDSYKERFMELMGPHLPDQNKAENYFISQSLWDDTMAWRAVTHMKERPQDVLVIIVGEFHVQHGGGLPDRIQARMNIPVITISQVNSAELSDEEVLMEVQPSEKYGKRAHFVWVEEALSVLVGEKTWSRIMREF